MHYIFWGYINTLAWSHGLFYFINMKSCVLSIMLNKRSIFNVILSLVNIKNLILFIYFTWLFKNCIVLNFNIITSFLPFFSLQHFLPTLSWNFQMWNLHSQVSITLSFFHLWNVTVMIIFSIVMEWEAERLHHADVKAAD